MPVEGPGFVPDADVVVPAVASIDLVHERRCTGDEPGATFKVGGTRISRPGVSPATPSGASHGHRRVAQGNQAALAVDAYLRGTQAVNARRMSAYHTAELS